MKAIFPRRWLFGLFSNFYDPIFSNFLKTRNYRNVCFIRTFELFRIVCLMAGKKNKILTFFEQLARRKCLSMFQKVESCQPKSSTRVFTFSLFLRRVWRQQSSEILTNKNLLPNQLLLTFCLLASSFRLRNKLQKHRFAPHKVRKSHFRF